MKFCPECENLMRRVRQNLFECSKCGHRELEIDSLREPEYLRDFFPFKSLRPFQKEILDKIQEAVNSARFVILEAPVGFGKSAISIAASRYLGSSHILTATKQLQDQYTSDFGIPVVRGKSNYRCLIPTSTRKYLPCNEGKCEVDWALSDCPYYISFEDYGKKSVAKFKFNSKFNNPSNKICRYYEQKWFGFRAPITIYNYPFILSEIKYAGDVPRRRLLVCDEAHDLEKQIVNFASFVLKGNYFKDYQDRLGSEKDILIPNKGDKEVNAWIEVIENLLEMLQDFCDRNAEDDSNQEKIASCKESIKYLEDFIGTIKKGAENWVVNSIKESKDGEVEEVIFQPINIEDYTNPLFSVADNVLLMSGTLFSKNIVCRDFGIDEDDAIFISITDSTFPVSNRPIYGMDTVAVNRSNIDSSLEKLTNVINDIMDHHKSERGIIHTTSYKQANYIIQNVDQKNRLRLVTTESSFDRSTLLQIHSSNDSSVLISPSLYQGVDLKDDWSRFQIIVKVPYPDLSQKRTRVKMYKVREWYDWQTALRLVQTYGRSIRSNEDHAITYVLDSNFLKFIRNHKQLFPDFFLLALRDKSETNLKQNDN